MHGQDLDESQVQELGIGAESHHSVILPFAGNQPPS